MLKFARLLRSSVDGSLLPFTFRSSAPKAVRASLPTLFQLIARRWRSRRWYALLLAGVLLIFFLLYVQFFLFQNELQQQMDRRRTIHNIERDTSKSHAQKGGVTSSESEHKNRQQQQQGQGDEFHPRQQVLATRLFRFSGPTNDRQRSVRDEFIYAWKAYKRHAWGHDNLAPLSHGFQDWIECGVTIVDSLDTLLIMNLKEEFAEAKRWVQSDLNFDRDRFVSLFETTIRVLGGLLSAYHLSGDQIFLTKAEDIGNRLLPAISHSPSAVPYYEVNLRSGQSLGGDSSLSEVASLQLEFRDLARLTGNHTYERLSFRTSEHIHRSACVQSGGGLCGINLSPQDGEFKDRSQITFGARGDSYYEYLLKQWIQIGKSINWLIDDYKQAMASVQQRLWKPTASGELYFVGELNSDGEFEPKMDHLVCFLAGTLALGTQHGMPPVHIDMAHNLSATCKAMYDNPSGLGPEIVWFNMTDSVGMRNETSTKNLNESKTSPDFYIKPADAYSILRPEAFEAWFYLYRLTGDPKYQEWGWAAFQAIRKLARLPDGDGYASVENVNSVPVQHKDLMESFFLAESLKYLYLLLSDDQTVLPLDRWVFNTEAHPLPIRDN